LIGSPKPDKQDFVAKDHFTDKYKGMVRLLAEKGKTLDDYLDGTVSWAKCRPSLQPPAGIPEIITITMSGLLSRAHLRGAEGVIALLVDHENRADENGTAILQYVYQFGGYETPFS